MLTLCLVSRVSGSVGQVCGGGGRCEQEQRKGRACWVLRTWLALLCSGTFLQIAAHIQFVSKSLRMLFRNADAWALA